MMGRNIDPVRVLGYFSRAVIILGIFLAVNAVLAGISTGEILGGALSAVLAVAVGVFLWALLATIVKIAEQVQRLNHLAQNSTSRGPVPFDIVQVEKVKE